MAPSASYTKISFSQCAISALRQVFCTRRKNFGHPLKSIGNKAKPFFLDSATPLETEVGGRSAQREPARAAAQDHPAALDHRRDRARCRHHRRAGARLVEGGWAAAAGAAIS